MHSLLPKDNFLRTYLTLWSPAGGGGWPLGSRLWCLLWVCRFPVGVLGRVWCLIVSIPDLCTITYLTTAGDWDFVAVVERLHALHYSIDFIFLSFGIICFIVEL